MAKKFSITPEVALRVYNKEGNLTDTVDKLRRMGVRNYLTGKPLSRATVWRAIVRTPQGARMARERARNHKQSEARRVRVADA
jgi:hypothetical protein